MVIIKHIVLIIILFSLNSYECRAFEADKEYIIQVGDKKYIAFIYLKETIKISLMEIEIISSSYYYVDLTLELLCKYNKIFKQYDTLEEAYNALQKLFEREKVKIYNLNENIKIGFIMNSATCDNEEVIIEFKEKKMDKDEIDEKLRTEINILTKKIKVLEKEVKNLENKIMDYELRLNYLELKEGGLDTKIIYKKSELQFIIDE